MEHADTCRYVPTELELRQQKLDIRGPKIANQAVLPAEDGVGETPLRLLKLEHFFLHRVTSDQAISKDLPRLTDAMGAVDRLCFNGRVPPGIKDKT